MKSIILTSSISRNAGGLFTAVRRLSQCLNQHMNVDVFSLRDKYSYNDMAHWLPLKPELFDTYGPGGFGFAPGMLKALKTHKADVLHCHGIWMYPALANVESHKKTKMPYVVSPHGMVDPWALKNSRLKKAFANLFFEKRHLKNASCLHSLCNSETEAIRRLLGKDSVVCQIPNGIDLPAPSGSSRPTWMFAGRKTLLYLGRIHPKKGLVPLLKAWATLKAEERAKWSLAVAGWDQDGHENELKRMAKNLGIAESVIYPGPLFNEQKDSAYRHSDGFILSSYSEGLPMTVLEAWAYALPAIISPECNLPEGFAAGAALNTQVSIEDIAKNLRIFFEMSDGQRKDMGAAGRKLAAENFSWDAIARQFDDVYRWILGGGAKPSSVI